MTAHSQIIPAQLPVIVIGAGPVGLAAAAHLIARNIPVKLLEAGASVAANVRDWGHVQLFSPGPTTSTRRHAPCWTRLTGKPRSAARTQPARNCMSSI